ncbi:transmembrane serine protease filzig [Lycorma delicatula]|uniref:transmembrane serine protease filzig n=1 Tax=Lycorma delicatula TaxID=130591 RepID=UPI003F517C8B
MGCCELALLMFCAVQCESVTLALGRDCPIERRFGGYRIVPKSCKDMTSNGKSKGVCMFNYECSQREGTVVGSCMDGFLFGACCRLPPGSAFTPVDHLISSPSTHSTTSMSVPIETASNSVRPMTYKPAPDTILVHKNGTVVQDTNSPEEFEMLSSKPELSTFSYVSGLDHQKDETTDIKWTTWTTGTESSKKPSDTDLNSIKDDGLAHTTLRYSPKPGMYSTNKAQDEYWTQSNFHSTVQTSYYSFNKEPIKHRPDKVTTSPMPPVFSTDNNEDNMVKVPTLTVEDLSEQDVEDATNAASINHILNILNDTTPIKTNSSPSLSTWVAVSGKPEKSSTSVYYSSTNQYITNPSTEKYHYSTDQTHSSLGHHKPSTLSSHFNSSHYYTQTPPTTNYYYYDSTKPVRPTQASTTTQNIAGPSFQVTPQVNITPKPQSGVTSQEPAPTVIVLGPLHPVSTKKPVTTTTSTTYRPPTTEAPQKHGTIVTIKPQQTTIITLKPGNRPQKPSVDPHKPQYTQIIIPNKPSNSQPDVIITTSSGQYKPPVNQVHYEPVRPPISEAGTYITAKPQLPVAQKPPYGTIKPLFQSPEVDIIPESNNSTELFAFPPVRDPNVNLTATQQEIDQTTLIDENSTPHFTVDENLDNKVHGFVEKIVQSLEGNFVDLENVLLDGGTQTRPNVTVNQVPVKRPTTTVKPQQSSTTKRPIKRPSSPSPSSPRPTTAKPTKLSTSALITRPPPTSTTASTTTRRPPTSTTVVLFQPIPSATVSTTTTTKKPKITKRPTSTTQAIEPDVSPTESSTADTTTEEIKPTEIDYRKECGVRPLMKNGRIVGGKGATFGEWPWQVLVREATWLGLFTKNKCGGVLITNRYVITAAHCQPGFLASLVAVFGEYDISGELESKRSVSKNVRRVIVHRQYDAATFENDIALLELDAPIQFDTHIVPICMPRDDEDFTGRMATVTGWGRLKYGGGVPSVLQEVHVPVMENTVCQEMFQTAGHTKSILNSFVCAGYANGQRDSCEGDSGGPLMVEREDGHWVLAGTVSHGIKCAAPYLPGVYMRTTYYKPWLQTITGVRNL